MNPEQMATAETHFAHLLSTLLPGETLWSR